MPAVTADFDKISDKRPCILAYQDLEVSKTTIRHGCEGTAVQNSESIYRLLDKIRLTVGFGAIMLEEISS